MVSTKNLVSYMSLAGLAHAAVTSIVYITTYETNCNVCTASSQVVVAVAASPVVKAAVTTATTATVATAIVAQGPVVIAAKSSSTDSLQLTTRITVTSQSTVTHSSPSMTATVQAASASIAACPATAHVDALGSKNYPRVITPVSSKYPNTVYGPQYFPSIGGGNSTIFTFDYQTAGTCTLEFKFPTMAQIVALKGTTSYTISSSAIAVTLYQLASVASPNADYANKPARGAAYSATLVPGQNSTITSFSCPVGTSVSYELVATDANSLSWFEDYNPPPLGLLALMC
ncbi:Putative uncharacterized protein [Taphrina deformans PYCC 5710]|uniref:Ubiquitin 3 binding protein But2 C-terminal domain-containing protein n=1 Tax=Taphrina deformans (strain PYCC 5710 / ATCC 11124 / CBS 356.35 / IMI 108563 / JCM 9778 / NBRC 8474) TaxID=1097556 RepID=R4X6E7_TAPDE|nr:Putative uncharacterized protein [Taphrina deformans PYCC 5710]|eukprot:CCG80654.1 Putative uncharacterized protein [Taphrina deformans PYCC 5710]